MKSASLVLIILIFTVPAMAGVAITRSGTGNTVTVSYIATGGLARAFALDISVDNGANIISVSDVNPNYWVYPGSIAIDDTGTVTDYGSPVVGSLPASSMTVENGFSWLIRSFQRHFAFTFDVDNDCNVVITSNAIRAGVVMQDGSSGGPINSTCMRPCCPPCACPGYYVANNKIEPADLYALLADLVAAFNATGSYLIPCP